MENMEMNNNKISIIDSITLDGIQKTLTKINQFHAIVKATLIPEIDYGMIPGAKKPMLFKSGAENILMLFGLSTTVDIVTVIPEQMTKETNFISYTVKCSLRKNNLVASEGIGTCNSSEKKYESKNALDIANTVLKMAAKRALVDAVLHVASLSAVFAQETDDINEYLKREMMDNLGVNEASGFKVNFGKHKGKTAGEVYKQHYDYVEWFFANGKDEKLRKAFEVLSEAVKTQAERAVKRTENIPDFEHGSDVDAMDMADNINYSDNGDDVL